jgi:protein-S-isoprenylcysteine O-methyltransferase Ste14
VSFASARTWIRIVAGLGGNAALLLVPSWLLGAPPLPADPSRATFLLGASLLCLGDLTAPDLVEVLPPDEERGAAVYAFTLLLVHWTALASAAIGPPLTADGLRLAGGFFLMLLGSALRGAAVQSLGDGFRTAVGVPDGQLLVRGSVHRWMRHPAEAGLLLASLGGCVILRSGFALALWALALVPAVMSRIRAEEAALAAALGATHAAYVREVGMFGPRFF